MTGTRTPEQPDIAVVMADTLKADLSRTTLAPDVPASVVRRVAAEREGIQPKSSLAPGTTD
jgi:hypothetical protein